MANDVNNQYEFILNPQKPPRPPMVDLGSMSMIKRIAIFVGGVMLLLTLLVSGLSFLNRASGAQGKKLLEIAQTQTEIARVALAAQEKIGGKELLFRAINVQYSINSSKQQLVAAIAKRGLKADEKNLGKGQNPQNDAILLAGEQNAKFDETYEALLNKQLANYQLQLQGVYDGSTASEKAVIENAFSQLELLSPVKTTSQ
jgi:hypothetical protein